MRTSLIISVAIHGVMMLLFQQAFPSPWSTGDHRIYRVDLYRPPIEDPKDVAAPGTAVALRYEEADPPGTEDAEISLDTTDRRYVGYAGLIKKRILNQWVYPKDAREQGLQGKLLLVFGIDRNGALTGLEIREGSGHRTLDDEAARAVRDSAPFPPFPDHLKAARLNIRADFDYRLNR